MEKQIIKIMSLEGAEINEYKLGVRNSYRIKDAVLSYSLLQEKLLKEGLTVVKGFTRDIINVKFGFGSQDVDGEIKRLNKAMDKLDEVKDADKIVFMKQLKEDIVRNKDKYIKKTVKNIREEMYKEGFSLSFRDYPQLTRNSKSYNKELVKRLQMLIEIKDKKERTEKINKFYRDLDDDINTVKTTINYKMLFRSPAKARVGEIIFIKKELYDNVHNWMTMGIELPEKEAKIVEMSAYSSLVSSTISDKIHIPIENILIVKDLDSITEIDIDRVVYKDNMCKVEHGKGEVKNTIWDGMGLIDCSLMEGKGNGMILTRQHFFKSCLFNTDIQQYFKDYYKKGYETARVKDMFGNEPLAKNIKVIVTENSIKWLKFKELMGANDKEAYRYWCDRVKEENCDFGICKTDHKSKLNINGKTVQQMSYQMTNTTCNDKSKMENIAKLSIDYVNDMKVNNELFIDFLDQRKAFSNINEMMIALYNHNVDIANTDLFRELKSDILAEYKSKLKRGKILQVGDNLTVCGNPMILLKYVTGEIDEYINNGVIDGYEDETLPISDDYISCYTKLFDEEFLAGFRSPHNAMNNILFFKNIKHKDMDTYFKFSNNIIAVNLLKNGAQDRGSGFDEDSDAFYVCNTPEIVECAKEYYKSYPTIKNDIPKDNRTYNNTLKDYAIMDDILMQSKNAIGETTNLAQLALSYYWCEKDEGVKAKLYDNFVILATLAQVAIDNSKRKSVVDVSEEVKRIRNMECMKRNKPMFWKFVKKSKNKDGSKKNIKVDKKVKCPMNYLVECISNEIENASTSSTDDIKDFILIIQGKAKKEQMDKILSIVKEYDDFIKAAKDDDKDITYEAEEAYFNKLQIKDEETIDKLSKFKITDKTLNILIINALDSTKENSKYRNKLLNCLYRVNPDQFLKNFKMKKGENLKAYMH